MATLTDKIVSTRILLVDDDPVFIDRARLALEPLASLQTVETGRAAVATVPLWRPDIVLFDLLMHDMDGFAFLEAISEFHLERKPYILCTTDGRGAGTRLRTLPNWRVGTLVRSCSAQDLQVAINQAARIQGLSLQRNARV